jgi:hypothetical protein
MEAAKKRAPATPNTKLLELAPSKLAIENDFDTRLVNCKGSIPADIDLEL